MFPNLSHCFIHLKKKKGRKGKNTIKPSFSSGIRRRDTRILSTDKEYTIKKK